MLLHQRPPLNPIHNSPGAVAVSSQAKISRDLKKNNSRTPAFPNKLYHILLTEPESLICWAEHGLCFFVVSQERFVEDVLPTHFKQKKFSSFKRQLNFYGFRCLTKGADQGGFFHPFFRKGQPHLLPKVVRVSRDCNLHTRQSLEVARILKLPRSNDDLINCGKLESEVHRAIERISEVKDLKFPFLMDFEPPNIAKFKSSFPSSSSGGGSSTSDFEESDFSISANNKIITTVTPSPIPYNKAPVTGSTLHYLSSGNDFLSGKKETGGKKQQIIPSTSNDDYWLSSELSGLLDVGFDDVDHFLPPAPLNAEDVLSPLF